MRWDFRVIFNVEEQSLVVSARSIRIEGCFDYLRAK